MIKLPKSFIWPILILSAVIYRFFVLSQILTSYNFESRDSRGYLILSKNLIHSYFRDDSTFTELSLLRTPGYPILLHSLSSSVISVIVIQVFLSISISLLLVVLVKKYLPDSSVYLSYLAFVLSQLESSLFIYTYQILTEIFFTFLLMIFIVTLDFKSKNLSFAIFIFSVSILFCIILVRPIGPILIFTFVLMIFFGPTKRLYATYLLITILFIGIYSLGNYLRTGVFTTSTVINHNLLMYEGAGSRAISLGTTIEDVQLNEAKLRELVLGENAEISKINEYNASRGLKLIQENLPSYLKLHLIGIGKVFFGPNRAEMNKVFNSSGYFFQFSFVKFILVLTILLATLISSIFGLIGVFYYVKYNQFRFLTIFIWVYVIFSSGGNAYGRFRTPIAPILVLFAILVFSKWPKIRFPNLRKRLLKPKSNI